MKLELQIRVFALGPLEFAAEPDVGRLPLGANDRAGGALGAETGRAFFPTAHVESRFVPIIRRPLSRVSPGDGLLPGVRNDGLDFRRSGQRGPVAGRLF